MTALVDLLEQMTPEQREGALIALDAVSRPLTAREIERALRDQWVSKTAATKLGSVLHRFNIIAVVGAEQ
jgi:hypothetical protein